MDPVIGQLPSNSIFMEQDHRPKSDLLWQSTRDLFFIYIYIYLFVTFLSFSCFPGLYLFLYLHHPPMLSRGCLICCRRYRTDGSFFHFSRIPSPLLNRSTFCPESSEFWLHVVKQMWARGHERVTGFCTGSAESADTYFPCVLVVCCCSIAGRDSRVSIFNGRNNWISNQGSDGNVNFCKWKLFKLLTFVLLFSFYFSVSS